MVVTLVVVVVVAAGAVVTRYLKQGPDPDTCTGMEYSTRLSYINSLLKPPQLIGKICKSQTGRVWRGSFSSAKALRRPAEDSSSALHLAAQEGFREVVEVLLEAPIGRPALRSEDSRMTFV